MRGIEPVLRELDALRRPAAEMRAWGRRMGWRLGCNYTPRTASNQLELWQAATWNPRVIDEELGWAAEMGMNTIRVFLHDVLHREDWRGLRLRMNRLLEIANRHGILVLFVLFDDCWNPVTIPGPQTEPEPGVHNSRWLKSPTTQHFFDPLERPRLRRYVTDVIRAFSSDRRILGWDLYNEPNNRQTPTASMGLLLDAFTWARTINPKQPLTVGAWGQDETFDRVCIQLSDVVTFHHYGGTASVNERITELKAEGRPVICTEWLARRTQNVTEVLSLLAQRGVGALNWGLVDGRTQTKFPWGSPLGGPEPDPWFHELLRADGSAYRVEETRHFRALADAARGR